MTLITLEWFYALAGAIMLGVALRIARDAGHPRRAGSAAFWALLGLVFVTGKWIPAAWAGLAVVILAVLAATGQVVRSGERERPKPEREAEAARLGNRLFWPALLVPAVTVLGSLTLGRIAIGRVHLVDPKQVTLIALGCGAVAAMALALRFTRAPVSAPMAEGSRLLQTLGWSLVLPQLLAALGLVFAQSGVGEVVAGLVAQVLPTQFPFVAVAAYCLGMALFTICLGNAFAAFAVITGGIGLPLIVQRHGGDPAIMAAIGMLSGYCGTLLTPLAANFNLVPALLLDLPDRNAVIKAQLPVALVLLAANVLLMWLLVYRF